MTAVALEMFQIVFLRILASQSKSTWKAAEDNQNARRAILESRFSEVAEEYLERFEAKHFTRKWKRKSLNHKDGKDALVDLFRKIYDEESVSNHSIYTGK